MSRGPLIDTFTSRVLRLQETQDPILQRARALMKEGVTNKKMGDLLGWHPLMVGRFKNLEDPRSALSLRVKGWREEKERHKREREQSIEQARIAREARHQLANMRRATATVSEPVQYERFLARERGDPIPGRRIPLLDYSEEDAQAEEVQRKVAWRQRFRQIGRSLLPVEERVQILVGIIRDPENAPADRMKAMHELHSIEGAIKKPTAEVKGGGGPLFSIPGGLPIQVAPVGPAALPPTRETDG